MPNSQDRGNYSRFAPWVPLFQTGLWILLIAIGAIFFRRHLNTILDVMVQRAESGAPFRAGIFEVGLAPASVVQTTEPITATAEGVDGAEVPADVRSLLDTKNFPPGIRDDVFLIHVAEVLRQRTTPGSGRYRVRIWVEAYNQATLDSVTRVTYRLYDDFTPRVVATSARLQQFELWLNTYGEFKVIAYAELGDGSGLWLSRYLNLPGRPPD